LVGNGEWLTPGEFATLLGVHIDTARAYADAGKVTVKGSEYPLTTTRLPGGHRRIKASDAHAARDAIYGEPAAELDSPPTPQTQSGRPDPKV
jgi:hypothetical protein